jgi:hypothetical protein
MVTITRPYGSLSSLADLREVNTMIKRKSLPLPKDHQYVTETRKVYVYNIFGIEDGIISHVTHTLFAG